MGARTRRTSGSASLAAAALGALALTAGGCTPETRPPLRVGISAWPGYEFLYLAAEKGFYADEGVDVRVVEFTALSDARRAYERGQIDAFATTVVEVVQARGNAPRSPQIVHVIDESVGADVLVARHDRGTVADLVGARVGVELGTVSTFLLARALQEAGLTLGDVMPVSMAQSSMFEAFRDGELDAVVTYPPTSLRLQRECDTRVLFSSADVPGEIVDVIAVDAATATARADDVAGLLRAFRRAMRYAEASPADAIGIMARRERLSPAEFEAAMTDGIRIVGVDEQARFLAPGGSLEQVVDRVDRVLRAAGFVRGADRRVGAVSDRFLEDHAAR